MTNINYELIDTTAPAPEQEPERQRYFIAKCREIIKERELEIGRKLTFYDQTFGCQMNFKDSEKLNGILEDIGYVKAEKRLTLSTIILVQFVRMRMFVFMEDLVL